MNIVKAPELKGKLLCEYVRMDGVVVKESSELFDAALGEVAEHAPRSAAGKAIARAGAGELQIRFNGGQTVVRDVLDDS